MRARAKSARRPAEEERPAPVAATPFEGQVDLQHVLELKDRVASLLSFNRTVAHDLRGPLSSISALAQLAAEALNEGNVALASRMVSFISIQGSTCAKLIDALFQLAKADHAELHRSEVDLQTVAWNVVRQFTVGRSAPALPKIEVLPIPPVKADPGLLHAVMQNLIGNAVKFTSGCKRPRIEVGGRVEGVEVIVHVRDNGVGFHPDSATKLFTPFVRLHAAPYEGHGVGLSIVRAAIHRHGGRVWATSSPGAGACFEFSLPYHLPTEENVA